MKTTVTIIGVGLLLGGLSFAQGTPPQAKPPAPPASAAPPGEVERAALARADFLVGDWEGEGWAMTRSGERQRFWVKEFYRYRGNKDLMDMEGRFGDILPSGRMTAENEYDLGILYFDRESNAYHMWHYSSDGTVFTQKLDVDIENRTLQYTKQYSRGMGKFRVAVGKDGVWVTTFEILKPNNSRDQVMEFRMKRLK